jgi:hypothetical protein
VIEPAPFTAQVMVGVEVRLMVGQTAIFAVSLEL